MLEETLNRFSLAQDPRLITVMFMVRKPRSRMVKLLAENQTTEYRSWAEVQVAIQLVIDWHSQPCLGNQEVFCIQTWGPWPPGWPPQSQSLCHMSVLPFSKPACFLSSPMNLPLQDIILLSFYSTLFQAVICVVIMDFLVADKLKGFRCLRTAAQASPGLMCWCQPLRAGCKLEPGLSCSSRTGLL